MDPYSVLGVRKNASRTEIELAYKGRRSQYHPDRYASEGAETVAWATGMMQAVNEAYAALSDPTYRPADSHKKASEHSRQNESTSPHSGQPEPAHRRDAASVLLKPEWDWDYMTKIFAKPNIPRSKLRGAIDSYAPEVKPGHVLILVDDTVFGGAKEGMLVTEDAIYAKQKFEAPKRVAFKVINKVEPLSHSRIAVNGHEFFKCNVVDHLEMGPFASRLGHVFVRASEDTPCQATDSEKHESQESEPKEAVLQEIEVELQEHRLAAGDPLNKALFTLMASFLKASRDFARVLEQNDFELDDEEQFVLSSDIVRFELLAFIFSNALNMLRSELGDDRAAEILAVSFELIIAEAIVRKEQLGHLSQISGPDKIRRLKHSKLFTPFQSRMHGFRGMSASSQTAAMFVENIQDPVMYALYTANEQEIIGTMVADVVEDILDEDTVEALLGEVERAVWTAIENYTAFGGR